MQERNKGRGRRPGPGAPTRNTAPARPAAVGHGLARVLSKLGHCSRKAGEALVRAGRVTVDGRPVLDPEHRTDARTMRIAVDGVPVAAQAPVYLMLNKPRGLVTTRVDPQGRPTVYECLRELDLPHLAPVGRLDRASEGLLLFTNDTGFADRLLDPATHAPKRYHVRIDAVPDEALLAALRAGVEDRGETLRVVSVAVLRAGARGGWLEIVLDEGRNRHIRRMLAACGVQTLRLVRVAIGELELGTLPKGAVRALQSHEVRRLRGGVR